MKEIKYYKSEPKRNFCKKPSHFIRAFVCHKRYISIPKISLCI